MVVVYGRRRIGKTALLTEFTKGRENIYFTGREDNAQANLAALSRAVLSAEGGCAPGAVFPSMEDALENVFEASQERRLVLVLDEYPHAARADRSLNSVLQILIDRYKDTSKLMIILCGSSVSYMESEVLSYKAPLFGRKTAQIHMRPMPFQEARTLLAGFDPEDQALAYGMVGGTPHYLSTLDPSQTIANNIRELFFDTSASLYNEPENLLRQEVREPAMYNAVLRTVAGGASRLNEIATGVEISTGSAAGYIKTLTDMELIKRELPYGEKKSRHAVYRISDNLFRWWYRFIPSTIPAITHGRPDAAYEQIAEYIPHYMGAVFEDICQQYVWEHFGEDRFPVRFVDLGRWWGTDQRTKQQVELDIVGDDDHGNALVGECKWTDAPVGSGVLRGLMDRSVVLPYPNKHFALFAKKGFTDGCRDLASTMPNVSLVSFPEMMAST